MRTQAMCGRTAMLASIAALVAACETMPPPTDPQAALIAKGRRIFFNETFAGTGRTCGTCHPADNNFTIDAAFIARLPANDPLFVAEFVPALAKNFENPRLMRAFGLILENLDGFDDPANGFVLRGVPHTLALRTSVASPAGPRTGWSGDGAPSDGTFNTPPLVEAADTGPFFHDNSVATLEAAVAFYDGDSFNDSPAGKALAGATGSGIRLDATQTQAIASFLRVLNALGNIRSSLELLESVAPHDDPTQSVFKQAAAALKQARAALVE